MEDDNEWVGAAEPFVRVTLARPFGSASHAALTRGLVDGFVVDEERLDSGCPLRARFTDDLDVLIGTSPENLERVVCALMVATVPVGAHQDTLDEAPERTCVKAFVHPRV